MKGKLIVIDGTDGSGKTVQTSLLVERLKKEGHSVELIEFPQYGQKSAGLIEEYLNGKYGSAEEVGPFRASIFFACDRYAAASKIRGWLDSGKIVITNRYVFSNMGHQAGKISDIKERDKFLEWVQDLEFNIFGIPRPDLNLLLFVPPKMGQKLVDKKQDREYLHGKKRDMHEADIDHLKNASDAYIYVAKKYGWPIIDCTTNEEILSREEIAEMVWEKVKDTL